MANLIPKKIKLIVNKAQGLQISENAKNSKNNSIPKWRVIFKGVAEKMATAKIESASGDPEWLCEIVVTVKNCKDPIALLVTDAKNNHIGQVVIPLPIVPPKPAVSGPNERPALLMEDLIKSELEPTKKISNPSGYVYYWMWTEEYWSMEEVMRNSTKKSLSKSLHNLSTSALNIFRRKSSTGRTSDSGNNQFTPKPAPRHTKHRASHTMTGNPFDDISNYPGDSNHNHNISDTSTSTFNSNYIVAQQQNPFNNTLNGYLTTGSSSPSNNNISASSSNYPEHNNPFEAVDISIENNIEKAPPYIPPSNASKNDGYNQVNLSHQTSIGSKESPSNRKRQGLFNKFRNKKSQSSADLTNMFKDPSAPLNIMPQSVGKSQGQRLFEKKLDITACSLAQQYDSSKWQTGSELNNRSSYTPISTMVTSANSAGEPYLDQNGSADNSNGYQHRTTKSNVINRHFSFNNFPCLPNSDTTIKEDMTKRDLIELCNSLERKLKASNDKIRYTEKDFVKCKEEKQSIQSELVSVRDELCQLKMRLLEAGDTKYLEKADERRSMHY